MKAFLERWRDIEGYEGLYQVSDFGEVRRLAGKGCKETRVLKPIKDGYGYLRVNLWKDGKMKHHKVHRLVAQAFIDNPENLPEVNHIDENKENNKVCSGMVNLEWCTRTYNNNHGTHNERMTETKSKNVLQLTLDGKIVREWASTKECGRNEFCQTAVSMCCNNKYGKQGNIYKGSRWMYAEDYYGQFA